MLDRDREQTAAHGDCDVERGGFIARMKRVWKEAKEKAEREKCAVCKLERRRGNFEECVGHEKSGIVLSGG